MRQIHNFRGSGLATAALRPLLAPISAAALALSLSACDMGAKAAPAAPPPPTVSVAEVLQKDVRQWDTYSGRVEAVQTVDLRPRVTGYIDKVNYQEGQEVHAGDVLFKIDDRTYQATLDAARAELAHAIAQRDLAKSEADRSRHLAKLQAVSAEELEQRESSLREAQAEVMSAQAAVEQAQLDLEFTQVRAPISGRAGRALVTAGNLVSPDGGAVLTTIVSQDKMYVYFDADERSFLRYQALARKGERASELAATLPADVALANDNGFPHHGVVDFLDNQLDPSSGTIRGRAVLDNKDRDLTPGLFARVRLPGSGQFQALLVDQHAILTDQDRKYVWVVSAQGTTERRDVTLGGEADGLRIIDSGLSAGDRVVVYGTQRIFAPGMPVQAQTIAMGAAPQA